HFISPRLVALFPATAVGENAHNNFIQILAELGSFGLAGFLWLVAAFLFAARKGVDRVEVRQAPEAAGPETGADWTAAQLGLSGGVVAFLLSCLVSHPLLNTEVFWLFLLVTGVAV